MKIIDLKEFKDTLHKILDSKGFGGAYYVLKDVEESDFEYNKSTFANLRNQAQEQLTQLSPNNYITSLRIFIGTILEKSQLDCNINNTRSNLEIYKENLYKYYLKFPYNTKSNIITNFFKKIDGFKNITLLVSGSSKEIKSANIQKFDWFTRHILFNNLKKQSIERTQNPEIANYVFSNWVTEPYAICQHFLSKLGNEKYFGETEIIDELQKKIFEILQEKSIVLAYKILSENHFDNVKQFLENIWKPLTDELQKNEQILNRNNSLVLVLLIENENSVIEKSFEELSFLSLEKISDHNHLTNKVNVKIALSYKQFDDWADATDSFFDNFPCDKFKCEWKEQQDKYLPECKSIEGLFEKITPQIFENLTFSQFLNNIKL